MNQEGLSIWLKGFCKGRIAGYKEGYEKGLFALEPQVPYTVKGMWIDVSLAEQKKHFAEDPEWLAMYKACLEQVKNETTSGK
jgi:hypothetical protein